MYKKTAAGNRSGFFIHFILYIVKKQRVIRRISDNFSSFVLLWRDY